MLVKHTTLRKIALACCCLSVTGCWGNKPNKKDKITVPHSTKAVDFFGANSEESSQGIPYEQTIYYFSLNSHTLGEKEMNLLNHVAAYLKKHNDIRAVLEGHADTQGPEAFNEWLAKYRASSVKSYLEQQGVAHEQIETRGYGNRELADLGDNETAHAKNRRVELKIQQD